MIIVIIKTIVIINDNPKNFLLLDINKFVFII